MRALITETDVRFILIDHSIQTLLREYAERIGENDDWLDAVFKGAADRPALIRHAPGHATHLHVRFFNPVAQRSAQRLYPLLIEHKLIPPPNYFHYHRVRKGETLGKLAKRYSTSVKSIMRANGLRSTLIQARKVYKIPRQGTPPAPAVEIPSRLLPPTAPERKREAWKSAESAHGERNLPAHDVD